MHNKSWSGKLYICEILLIAAAVFTGCSQRRGEKGPEGAEYPANGEENSGIRIEIVDSSETKTQERETVSQLTPFEKTVCPGDILDKEAIEEIGISELFTISSIDSDIFERMNGNSYKEGCPVPPEDLRYVRILHYDFEGNIRVGELVCNQSVSDDLLRIFKRLYDAEYPVEKVRLIDDYGGDDELSSSDNNTSCFNYRTVAGSSSLSRHALGTAIDINPLYNPYITRDEQGEIHCAPAGGAPYMDRSQNFPFKIDEEDLCCQLFIEEGFTWGGSWKNRPDYMHFSRGTTPEGGGLDNQ